MACQSNYARLRGDRLLIHYPVLFEAETQRRD